MTEGACCRVRPLPVRGCCAASALLRRRSALRGWFAQPCDRVFVRSAGGLSYTGTLKMYADARCSPGLRGRVRAPCIPATIRWHPGATQAPGTVVASQTLLRRYGDRDMLLDVGRRTRKTLDRARRWSEIGGFQRDRRLPRCASDRQARSMTHQSSPGRIIDQCSSMSEPGSMLELSREQRWRPSRCPRQSG